MGGSLEDESQYKISRKQGHEHNYNLSKEKVQIIICQKNATKKKKTLRQFQMGIGHAVTNFEDLGYFLFNSSEEKRN